MGFTEVVNVIDAGSRAQGKRQQEPLGAIYELLEAARNVEPLKIAGGGEENPMEGLRQLIDQARRQEAGPGAEAMARLYEEIEAAKELPDALPYERPAGDPLAALRATMSGDQPRVSPPTTEQRTRARRPTAEPGDQGPVGAALLAALEHRPLPGPTRAEVARRLAELRQGAGADEIQALFELVVFGESSFEG
jgi:hypothetical protein